MNRRFTYYLFIVSLFVGFFVSSKLMSQNCLPPTSLSVSNISNFSATTNWDSVSTANYYRLRYKQLGSTTWINRNNITSNLKMICFNLGREKCSFIVAFVPEISHSFFIYLSKLFMLSYLIFADFAYA